MHNPTVSVIVPIYKVEAYLNQCIESIVKQTYPHLEILLLDDGSPDGSGAICDRWAEKDSRIRVVHKKNTGVSNTRNLGISLATGEYVTFVDSDDYLEPNAIGLLAGYAAAHQAQCVLGGYKRLYPDGHTGGELSAAASVTVCQSHQDVETIILQRMVGAEYRSITPLSQSACVKLYNRRLLTDNQIQFLPIREIGSEDFYFNICFFSHVERAVLIPETFYVYRCNGDSCSNTFQEWRLDSFLRLFRTMENHPLFSRGEEYPAMLAANILGGVSVCVKLLVASRTPDTISRLSQILELPDVRRMLTLCQLRYIRFPLSLFCILMKYRMKCTLYLLIKLFLMLA